MKILVAARHFGYLRNFESVLRELAARGHTLHVAADREENSGGREMVERLAEQFPQMSVGWTPRRDKGDQWLDLATRVRLSQDYLRYLDRAYDQAPMLRRRAKERTPGVTVWLVERAGFRFRPGRQLLSSALAALEDGVPLHEPYTEFLRDIGPDVVLITPLIDLGSPQLDLLKSAKALGIRTVLGVGSWDHLSSKALLRVSPDLVTVWNPVQRDEAIGMHGIEPERIAVTGAQCYDQWFGRQPSRSREVFCREMGLPPDKAFVLYVCSSLFRGDPPEADFTIEWIRTVRNSSDPLLRDCGILVRPHPGRLDEWKGHDVSALGVAFNGRNPIDQSARDDYFDALFYSGAVVGLNTSAFLEAAIVGRPVFAVLLPRFRKSQEGTLHFHYLLREGGGLLRTSRSLDEHMPQLAAALSGKAPANNTPFVLAFLRPHGLDQPATPRLADAIERVGRSARPVPHPAPWRGRATRPLLAGRLQAGAAVTAWRRRRKDLRHDVRKGRERTLRAVRKPLKRWSERGLALRWRALVPRTDRRQAWADSAGAQDTVRDTRQTVSSLRSSGRPIVVGPWLSETGFELLYWIPFLRWAQKYGNLRAERIVAVSRGGASLWYDEIAARYVDAFDVFGVDELRRANSERIDRQAGQKHYAVTDFDRELVRRALDTAKIGHYDWLHPSLMYNLFRPFWMQLAPVDLLHSFTLPRRLRVPALSQRRRVEGTPSLLPGLPERYIAVKFYTNHALPQTPENQHFVHDLLQRLTAHHEVVLLETGLHVDDHAEFDAATSRRLHRIDGLLTPQNNLSVQTQVIAGADALVMTYGGFSYLGPMLGVQTLTFYSDPRGFRLDHLDVAQRTFREVDGAQFVALDTQSIGGLEALLGMTPVGVRA